MPSKHIVSTSRSTLAMAVPCRTHLLTLSLCAAHKLVCAHTQIVTLNFALRAHALSRAFGRLIVTCSILAGESLIRITCVFNTRLRFFFPHPPPFRHIRYVAISPGGPRSPPCCPSVWRVRHSSQCDYLLCQE